MDCGSGLAIRRILIIGSMDCHIYYFRGMLDPWFKKTYWIKHLKKQAYWWLREFKSFSHAKAVCFTTDEECVLARNTFFPYRCNEVDRIRCKSPPSDLKKAHNTFLSKFPKLKNKDVFFIWGVFIQKKEWIF